MQIGSYRLSSPLDPHSTGAAFHAVASDGTDVEIRLLDRLAGEPGGIAALERRLRLIALADVPGILQPIEYNLRGDQPFIALPLTIAAAPPAPVYSMGVLADALAFAHRVGLTFGAPGRQYLRRSAGKYLFDLTDTAGFPTGEDLVDPANDVARFAEIFLQAPDRPPDWDLKLRRLTGDVADRPMAAELPDLFRPAALDRTADVKDMGGTMVQQVEPMHLRPPKVGDRLGRFLLQEKLGEGTMGIVFKAEDPGDGSTVAIKVLRTGAATEKTYRRFVREGRILASLDSPFVTRLVEANTDGDRCFLALEFVPGASLGDRLKEVKNYDEATALRLMADASRGLAAAHAIGLVHRDIKPDNLLVTTDEDGSLHAKVTDFGLARSIRPEDSLELTRQGAAIGTPLYMAPEQFSSASVDARADVYGLGATLFHLISGRTPFMADGLAQLAAAVAMQEAPPLHKLAPGTSNSTSTLVAKCLSKDPAQRPVDGAAVAREIERIQGGEVTELTTHPRTPAGPHSIVEYVHTWELVSPPAKLWPMVSNTERLNKAIGLPSVQYSLRHDPGRGPRRFARARVVGMSMEWEEHPFEWIEGRRMGVLREFHKGPLLWYTSVVELNPLPTGGTLLKHTLRGVPRGILGKIAGWFEMKIKARRTLGKVYHRIDHLLTLPKPTPADDGFEQPSQLPSSRQARVDLGVERLVAMGCPPDSSDLLGLFLSNAADQEVARVRPIALARRFGLNEAGMIETCLRAVGAGLLQLQWDVICPICRIPSGRKDTLRELKDHENCPTCDSDFRSDFATSVELVFGVHPDIRPVQAGTYCAGGPSHSPHVVAQARLAPREELELQLSLTPGSYRLRGPQLPWKVDFRVIEGAVGRRWEPDLKAQQAPAGPTMAPNGQVVVLRNRQDVELVLRVERSAARDDALTAARATAIPAFRELFPGELLSPGQLAPASTVSLVVIQVSEADEWYKRLGEAEAFRQFRAAFLAIEDRVKLEGGAVVKAVGDGLEAAFGDVTAAVRTVLGLRKLMASGDATREVALKVGVNRGLALIATVNDRLDYFGQTARTAHRLADTAKEWQALLAVAAAADVEITNLLRDRVVQLADTPTGLAYRVEL